MLTGCNPCCDSALKHVHSVEFLVTVFATGRPARVLEIIIAEPHNRPNRMAQVVSYLGLERYTLSINAQYLNRSAELCISESPRWHKHLAEPIRAQFY